ncbi:MAG: isoprenylcysteine carboxylmethyltransferase family protein [Anaerolineae bacterium]|nr:isoprenylcysteine carboxylmethyltransferase family protein [Anaerolineae bacterium]
MTQPTVEQQKPLFNIGDLIKVVVMLAIMVGAMAGLAGRWDWWAGWSFLAVFFTYSLLLFAWLARIDPALMRERKRDSDARNRPYERTIIPVMVTLEIAVLAVAALDGGRFGWSTVPVWVRIAGWALLAVTGAIIPWVFRTNTYASGVGRIQDDREHHVIDSGPYRTVRHPMYTGVIIACAALPLTLGSWWALIPGGLLAGLFVVRTALEDRMLHEELPGYDEYAQRTRYRLIPGIW